MWYVVTWSGALLLLLQRCDSTKSEEAVNRWKFGCWISTVTSMILSWSCINGQKCTSYCAICYSCCLASSIHHLIAVDLKITSETLPDLPATHRCQIFNFGNYFSIMHSRTPFPEPEIWSIHLCDFHQHVSPVCFMLQWNQTNKLDMIHKNRFAAPPSHECLGWWRGGGQAWRTRLCHMHVVSHSQYRMCPSC